MVAQRHHKSSAQQKASALVRGFFICMTVAKQIEWQPVAIQ